MNLKSSSLCFLIVNKSIYLRIQKLKQSRKNVLLNFLTMYFTLNSFNVQSLNTVDV